MTVTHLDVGRTVRWTDEHGHTHTGILHRYPAEGSPDWWRTHGKVTVAIRDGDDAGYWHLRPEDLTVIEPEEALDGS